MSNKGEFPIELQDLYPDQISDPAIFTCPYSSEDVGFEYLHIVVPDPLPETMISFCKNEHGNGRNVMYVDHFFPSNSGFCRYPENRKGSKTGKGVYRGLMNEDIFQREIKRMLNTPTYREQYSPEAIEILEEYLDL